MSSASRSSGMSVFDSPLVPRSSPLCSRNDPRNTTPSPSRASSAADTCDSVNVVCTASSAAVIGPQTSSQPRRTATRASVVSQAVRTPGGASMTGSIAASGNRTLIAGKRSAATHASCPFGNVSAVARQSAMSSAT